MAHSKTLPPTWFFLAIALMALLHFLFSGPRLIFGVWRLAGVIVLLPCVVLTGAADQRFKQAGTEIKPFRPSSAVVSTGPYRFARHPMYLAFTGITLGLALVAGTATPFLVVVALAWLLRVRYAIPEERHMEEQFGEEYHRYQARVRRWF